MVLSYEFSRWVKLTVSIPDMLVDEVSRLQLEIGFGTPPESQMRAAQVYFLEKQIEEDVKLFATTSVFEIHYCDLDYETVYSLSKKLGLMRKKYGLFPKVSKDDMAKLAPIEKEQLEGLANAYPFKRSGLIEGSI